MNSDIVLNDDGSLKIIAEKIECEDGAELSLKANARSNELTLNSKAGFLEVKGRTSDTKIFPHAITTSGLVSCKKTRVFDSCNIGDHLQVGTTKGDRIQPSQGLFIVNGADEGHSIAVDGNKILVTMPKPAGLDLIDVIEDQSGLLQDIIDLNPIDTSFGPLGSVGNNITPDSQDSPITIDLVDTILKLRNQVRALETKIENMVEQA